MSAQMPKRVRLLLVVGTRPNFMKVAPVMAAVEACGTATPQSAAWPSSPVGLLAPVAFQPAEST